MAQSQTTYTHVTNFAIGQPVKVADASGPLLGVVTQITFRSTYEHVFEVSWLHNGTSQSAWFQPWRLFDANQT